MLALLVAVIAALYVNLLSTSLSEESGGLWDSVKDLGKWNALVLIIVLLLVADVRIENRRERQLESQIDDLVMKVLAAATESILWPHRNRPLRAIVTVREGLTENRVTLYAHNTDADPERMARFPMHFGVTGEAIRRKATVLEELPSDHAKDYDESVRPLISDDLRTVLAAPLFDPDARDLPAFGALAFDSSLSIESLRFDKPGTKQCAQHWADVIAQLLIVKGYSRWGS